MGEEHSLTDRGSRSTRDARHGDVISKRMAQWTTERTTDEALAELEKAKIPAGPLDRPQQVLEDVHIRAAGFSAHTDYPGLPRPAPLAPTPVGLSETPGRFAIAYRCLASTRTILAESATGRPAIVALAPRRSPVGWSRRSPDRV